jgi:hypothetical protein
LYDKFDRHVGLIITCLLSFTAFYEVGLNSSSASIDLFSWIDSEYFLVSWGFTFDSLTVSMLIPIVFISSLVHMYSISYMGADPHTQRFFSYLSAFTFCMLLLVCGDNLLVLFVGWEGVHNCLKWCNIENIIFLYSQLPIIGKTIDKNLNNNSNNNITSFKVGPHNIDVISIIIGSTLGDTHLEKRSNGIGTRIKFVQSNKNVEYLMWYHKFFSDRGYCNSKIPELKTRIRKNGENTFEYSINSFTYASFNWIHEMFYTFDEGRNKYIKIVPKNLEEFLTPQALAVWFMDDGSKSRESARIATNNFTIDEIEKLCLILENKYNIKASVQSSGKSKGHILFIYKNSMENFSKIVKPFMLPSLYYKLGNY